MSLTFTKRDKSRCISVLREIAKVFLFHGVSFQAQQDIMAHLDWHEKTTEDLHIDCRLESDPATKTTQIIITMSLSQPLPNVLS